MQKKKQLKFQRFSLDHSHCYYSLEFNWESKSIELRSCYSSPFFASSHIEHGKLTSDTLMPSIRLFLQHRSALFFCFLIYLCLWIVLNKFDQSIDRKKTSSVHRSNSSFVVLFDFLYEEKIRLILIDPEVLDHLYLRRLSFETINQRHITFAIDAPLTRKYLKNLSTRNVTVNFSTSQRIDGQQTIEHIFLTYRERLLHLAVLHQHRSYYLIEENDFLLPTEIELAFGDVLRSVELDDLEYSGDQYGFYYPRNVSHFLWLYDTSMFLHCNRTLADQMENEFHLLQNASQLNLTVGPMRHITQKLNHLHKRYWLAGGTLLGWYRHCGLIPFTQDVDFGLFAEEYDEHIRNEFLGDPMTYIWGALGLVNDSLEFRLYTGRFTFDLFWAYKENDYRWCGYQVQRIKFRRTLPLLEHLCSADLFGYRFTVPCEPVDYLDAEYGLTRWQSPKEKNYTWVNMKYHSSWNDISWMYAVRLYTREGRLRTDKYAINMISDHFNYTLTKIPSFLNVIPDEPVTLPPLKKQLIYRPTKKRTRS